jgi:two-component system, sensor histidine kinase
MIPAFTLAPGVQRELFILGYKNILASGIGGMAAATLLGAALWSMRQTQSVLLWMGFAYATNCFAWYLLFAFRNDARQVLTAQIDQATLKRISQWRFLHTLFVVASCCIWAGLCALLDVADPRANVLILVCMLAVLAFAASSHGVHNIVSFVLSVVIGLPIMLYYLPGAFTLSVTPIAILFGMFGVVCVITAINANRTMITAIELRLSNDELVSQYALAAERADQASREKSNFLAAAAHDMRQPVHSLMLLQGVLRQTEGISKSYAVLDQMQSATTTIASLFDSVMELSRLESGGIVAHSEPIAIESFVAQRIAQNLPTAAEKGLRIRFCKNSSSVGAWISADKVLLMRLIDNLIGNAIKYTPQGGVLIALRKHTPRKLFLEVWDTGVGIVSSDVRRIFEPYFQVDNPTRNRERGLGLGLAIVRNCADLMAIPIVVTSKLGSGTRFRLTLTKTSAPSYTAPVLSEKQAPSKPDSEVYCFRGLRVLVLEDDMLVMNAMEAVFSSWSIDFKHARCFDEIAVGSWKPQLVLCDYRLPGRLNGLASLEQIIQRYPDVPCILQTGELSSDIPKVAQAKGYGLLVKPVTIEALAAEMKARVFA